MSDQEKLARYAKVFDSCGWWMDDVFWQDMVREGELSLRPDIIRICRDALREKLVEAGCCVSFSGGETEVWFNGKCVYNADPDETLLTAGEAMFVKEKE